MRYANITAQNIYKSQKNANKNAKKKTQNTYGSLLDNKAVLKAVHQEQLKPLAENYPFFAKSLFSLSEWYGNWIRIRTENWNRFTCVIHAWIPWLNPRTVACKKNGKHIFFLHLYICHCGVSCPNICQSRHECQISEPV